MPLDALEYVVRPFTSTDAHGAIIIPSAPKGSREKATLTWGQPISVPEIQTGINFNVVCCKDALNEHERTTESVRVYQDGDENSPNYIDYDRPLTMNLEKKESNTCGDNLDDISMVAQEVHADIAMWENIMNSGTTARPKNCGQSWKFKSKLT